MNVPRFDTSVRSSETAVFWLGQVDASRNYADVRLGYTDQELWIKVQVFDQWLWLDDSATRAPASLDTWDAISLLIDTRAQPTGGPASSSYRFVGQLGWWRPRTDYQAAFVGNGSAWVHAPATSFTTETAWRGDSPNNGGADRGWVITFRIPFTSLGLSTPADGAVWRLGVQLHDRDSSSVPATALSSWPDGFARDQPATWGALAFGLRPVPAPTTTPGAETHTIRHGLGGAQVNDAMVGGGSTCAEGTDFFQSWGGLNYAQSTTLVVQNQADVADWPCYSKFYVDFPLAALPAGKQVVGATLTIYQFGGSNPAQAQRSLVQVSTVADAWSEATITWNTAPLAVENVAQSWVDVIQPPGLPWPGAARTWDLSWAATQAYAAGQPVLRLAVYAADGAYHSGKYFTASDTGDWNAVGRPTLTVTLADGGEPPAPPSNLRVVNP